MEGSGIWALDVDVPGARHKHVRIPREAVQAF
jgi:hypothetical protein